MIRPIQRDDISQLPELHTRIWGTVDQSYEEVSQAYDELFPQLFLDHPWHDHRVTSLVHEEGVDGKISGMLAVMTRAMEYRGRTVTAAISSNLCVSTDSRSRLTGVEMLKQFINGPQDLSIADLANESSSRIWAVLGGMLAPLYSLHWVRVLRPTGFCLAKASRRKKIRRITRAMRPIGTLCDRFVKVVNPGMFHYRTDDLKSEQLTPELFLEQFPKFTRHDELRPIYDEQSVNWIWDRTKHIWNSGTVQKVVVKNNSDQILGWYIYQMQPGAICEVAQIVANEKTIHSVVRHLFHHAWQRGVVGLTGRVQPRFIHALSDQNCYFHRRGSVVLVHSHDAELMEVFQRTGVFLTHLEGEGCLHLYNRSEVPRASSSKTFQDISARRNSISKYENDFDHAKNEQLLNIEQRTLPAGEPDIDYVQKLVEQAVKE